MPMTFSLSIDAKEVAGATRAKVARALALGGQAWQTEARKYPAYPANGTHTRTMSLGKSANFNVTDDGLTVELTASIIYAYLLFGTGIYGPNMAPIYPKKGPFLVWPITNRASASYSTGRNMWGMKVGKQGSNLIFARSVKGSIWQGKLAEVKRAIIDAVLLGLRSE